MTRRLLIVDDDPSVREALKSVLDEAGYETVMAADGRQGAQELERQVFDLLILDLDLPEISGWDILDIVTARRPTLPVIVLTGYFDQCVPGALQGADAFIEKPPDVTRLLKLVESLSSETLEQRRLRRSKEVATAGSTIPIEQSYRRVR